MSSASSKIPVVFISSTSEDLSEYRTAARDAVLAAKFHPRMMEYFTASGERAPLAACLHEVDQTDLLVVIVAHRYGWVPGEQAAGELKSITWLECERAHASGKEVLAFLLDEHHAWPEEKKEEWSVTVAIREDRETPGLLAEVKRNRKLLKECKNWLNSLGIRAQYTTPESLGGKVSAALNDWRQRHPDVGGIVAATPIPKSDPFHYLDYLLRRTAYIELRGLKVGKGEAKRFPIEDLYIELSTPIALEAERASSKSKRNKGDAKTADGFQAAQRNVSQRLQRLLGPGCRVVIVGDPGAGKTTFLRRIANAFRETRLGRVPNAAESRLGIARAPFPIFVRVAELAGYIQGQAATPTAAQPTALDSPEWLLHFLEAKSAETNCPLLRPFWRDTLNAGGCLLLDGLDEAPDAKSRAAMARLAEHLATVYRESWLVITSRPAAYKDDSVIPGFQLSRVEPLTESAAITFLRRWSEALFQEDPEHARKHREELVGAIAARREIRQMARNPVMLTALAVVHWNDKRLPEQRAELYESIIHWLARSREERRGRLSAEHCVRLLQELALAMQTDQKGRRVQVAKRWAAEILALQFPSTTPTKRTKSAKGAMRTSPAQIAAAEAFLDAEELDSGIVVARGNELCFWHLSFQEYLVAKAIAARAEADQRDLLWNNRRYFYQPEWREVVLLLGGVLYQQGRQKVDALIATAIESLGSTTTLSDQARCAGVLGAVIRDLQPYQYEPALPEYIELQTQVKAIFDPERSANIAITERIAAADALDPSSDPGLDPEHAHYWIDIPVGEFLMGAQKEDAKAPNYDPDAYEDESPVRAVRLAAFRIGRFPVTVSQYQRFIEANGYADNRWWSAGGFGEWEFPEDWDNQEAYPRRPVVGVNWYEAMAYCRWGKVTLPTEAQWERAARGTEGRRYPWGAAAPDTERLNFGNNVGHPTPVGIYPRGATAEGIEELAGNVLEWTRSLWGDKPETTKYRYPYDPMDGREDETAGRDIARVLRGGAFHFNQRNVRCAYRDWDDPGYRDGDFGFRVVLLP